MCSPTLNDPASLRLSLFDDSMTAAPSRPRRKSRSTVPDRRTDLVRRRPAALMQLRIRAASEKVDRDP